MLQNENLVNTLDQLKTTVYLKNIYGRYISMNSNGIQLLRETRDQVLGKTPFSLFDSQTAQQMADTDAYVSQIKGSFTSVFDAKDKSSGKSLPIFTTKVAVVSPSRLPLGILGISLTGMSDRSLYAEARSLLPKFILQKQSMLVTELLELKTVGDFFNFYRIH
ncbi:MAG: hypothetical protein K2Q26_04995 [Bdellovibrionales bacterium]|nr:hypothetical protein [Bdellovibrionales bacterium]